MDPHHKQIQINSLNWKSFSHGINKYILNCFTGWRTLYFICYHFVGICLQGVAERFLGLVWCLSGKIF